MPHPHATPPCLQSRLQGNATTLHCHVPVPTQALLPACLSPSCFPPFPPHLHSVCDLLHHVDCHVVTQPRIILDQHVAVVHLALSLAGDINLDGSGRRGQHDAAPHNRRQATC